MDEASEPWSELGSVFCGGEVRQRQRTSTALQRLGFQNLQVPPQLSLTWSRLGIVGRRSPAEVEGCVAGLCWARWAVGARLRLFAGGVSIGALLVDPRAGALVNGSLRLAMRHATAPSRPLQVINLCRPQMKCSTGQP